jgi:hypothetical protein
VGDRAELEVAQARDDDAGVHRDRAIVLVFLGCAGVGLALVVDRGRVVGRGPVLVGGRILVLPGRGARGTCLERDLDGGRVVHVFHRFDSGRDMPFTFHATVRLRCPMDRVKAIFTRPAQPRPRWSRRDPR